MIITKGRYFLKYYPQHMILLSLVVSVCIGTLLLSIPAARNTDIALIDLFFTSASLTTATGFLTVPITEFTNFGHFIILLLMQLGGLGLMTLSLYFIYMFSTLGLYTQIIASEILSLKNFKNTRQTLYFIIKLTVITETLGALIIFPTLYKIYPFKKALFYSIFHSVSSFCNAGFTLFPEQFTEFSHNLLMIYTTSILIVIGGLGFVTWHELINRYIKANQGLHIISWHTKLVLRMYLSTSIVSSILFFLLERNHTLAHMSFIEQISISIFTGISMKSAGLSVIAFTTMQLATTVLAMVTMFIGSAPLSTGGGIKTTVFAIYLAVIKAAIQGKRQAMLYERHIIDDQVYKAMAIIALSISWIVFIVFCLCVTETHLSFLDTAFTTITAFSNNGLLTVKADSISDMTVMGKLCLILSMIIGRIGALAVVLSMRRIGDLRDISYPKEHVILG